MDYNEIRQQIWSNYFYVDLLDKYSILQLFISFCTVKNLPLCDNELR